jgi:hypothetical protein
MITLLPLLAILLVSCATTGDEVNDSDTATLQNRSKEYEKYDLSLIFVHANGKPLSPGYWTAPIKALYKIPPGNGNLIFDVRYSENLDLMKGGACLHRLIPLSATIEKGKTYVVEATVNDKKITAWIEEHGTGKIVSPITSKELVPCSHSAASLFLITK